MKTGIKFLLLLALLLSTASLRAEENGGSAVAEAPPSGEAAVIITDDRAVLEQVQREIAQLAERTGSPIGRQTLEGPGFETLPPEIAAPLTTDGNSTAVPQHAEDLAKAMDAERSRKLGRFEKTERFIIAVRTSVVGGITSYTMTVGAVNAHASEPTVTAAAAIGLAVGGGYSLLLHFANPKLQKWYKTDGFVSLDNENKPAKTLTPRIIKQAMAPIGLAVSMQAAKLASEWLPGIDFKTVLDHPGTVAASTAAMAATSVWFQFPWQSENADRLAQDVKAAGGDNVGNAHAQVKSKGRAAIISGLLSITNSLQLSGSNLLGASAAFAVGAAGHVYRYRSALKNTNPAATEPERGLASITENKEAEPLKKGLAAKLGNACSAGYSALKAATRTLASARRP